MNAVRKILPESLVSARRVSPEVDLTDEQAAEIGVELQEIAQGLGKEWGQLDAEEIVEAARDERRALNPIIWGKSDQELAYRHRCHLARVVVASIVWLPPEELVPVRQITSVIIDNKRAYVPTEIVKETPFMREQIRERALVRLRSWLAEFRAYRHCDEVAKLWTTIESLVDAE